MSSQGSGGTGSDKSSRRRRSSILKAANAPAQSSGGDAAVDTAAGAAPPPPPAKCDERRTRRISFAELKTVTVLRTCDGPPATHHEPAYVDSSGENSRLEVHSQVVRSEDASMSIKRTVAPSRRSVAMQLDDSCAVPPPTEDTCAFFATNHNAPVHFAETDAMDETPVCNENAECADGGGDESPLLRAGPGVAPCDSAMEMTARHGGNTTRHVDEQLPSDEPTCNFFALQPPVTVAIGANHSAVDMSITEHIAAPVDCNDDVFDASDNADRAASPVPAAAVLAQRALKHDRAHSPHVGSPSTRSPVVKRGRPSLRPPSEAPRAAATAGAAASFMCTSAAPVHDASLPPLAHGDTASHSQTEHTLLQRNGSVAAGDEDDAGDATVQRNGASAAAQWSAVFDQSASEQQAADDVEEQSRIDLRLCDTSLLPPAHQHNATSQMSPLIKPKAPQAETSAYGSTFVAEAEQDTARGMCASTCSSSDAMVPHVALPPCTVHAYELFKESDGHMRTYGMDVLRAARAKLDTVTRLVREKNEAMLGAIALEDGALAEALQHDQVPAEFADAARACDADAAGVWLQYNSKMAASLAHAYKREENAVQSAVDTMQGDLHAARQRHERARELQCGIDALSGTWQPVLAVGGVAAVDSAARATADKGDTAAKLGAHKETMRKLECELRAERRALLNATLKQVRQLAADFAHMRTVADGAAAGDGHSLPGGDTELGQLQQLLGVHVRRGTSRSQCVAHVDTIAVEFVIDYDKASATSMQRAHCRLAPKATFVCGGSAHEASVDWLRARLPIDRMNGALAQLRAGDAAHNAAVLHSCIARVANVLRLCDELHAILRHYSPPMALRFGAKFDGKDVIEITMDGIAHGVRTVCFAIALGDDVTAYPMADALQLLNVTYDDNKQAGAKYVQSCRLMLADCVRLTLFAGHTADAGGSQSEQADGATQHDGRPLVCFANYWSDMYHMCIATRH